MTATASAPTAPITPAAAAPAAADPRVAAARVDDLLTRLDQLGESRTRVLAEEIVRALMEFYGSGLARLAQLTGDDTVRLWGADPQLGALLAMHGLHPVGTSQRVEQAFAQVREQLGSQTPTFEITGPEEARVVVVRPAVPPASLAVAAAVEDAVAVLAPEVTVTIEGGRAGADDLAAGRTLLPVVGVSG
ncbi:hypothetical protein [Parafrankia elaeagni]|uniref:hypothetical protein n=1 Tax=Parafrankia elaeagni TaxID=222534 RepID=UPI00036C0378|nr:hypothetical protein [Parafrankia elaeagni]